MSGTKSATKRTGPAAFALAYISSMRLYYAFVTGIAILLAAGLRRTAVVILGLGVAVVLVLFLVHVAVTALKRRT